MYKAEDKIVVGPILYADDNLTPLSLANAEQIQPILDLYDQYTGVSGLNINVNKSTALCINTDEALQEGLSQAGLRLTVKSPYFDTLFEQNNFFLKILFR
jgi:hypothetical protein